MNHPVINHQAMDAAKSEFEAIFGRDKQISYRATNYRFVGVSEGLQPLNFCCLPFLGVNRGAVHRVAEVALCCALLSRAVDAFLFLIELRDVANSSDTYKWSWQAGGRRVGREEIRE